MSKFGFPGKTFDLRILGAVHILLLLLALGLLLRAVRDLLPAAQWTAAALLVLVYTDVGYAASFNSFYAQTASLVFFLLTVAIAAAAITRRRLTGPLLVAYVVSGGLFVASKPQEALQGPALAVWMLILSRTEPDRRRRIPALAAAAALLAFSIWYYVSIPRDIIRHVGVFHNMFIELLPHSPDPVRDLKELGLDPGLIRYNWMHAYMANSPINDPAFQARFFDRFGYRQIVGFYLRHPMRFLDRMSRAAPAAFRLRPKYLGNFEESTGVPPRTKSTHFAVWSDLRAKLAGVARVWLVLFFGLNFLAVVHYFSRSSGRMRLALASLAVLLSMAIVEFLACSLGDDLNDLGRHLFAFDAIVDLVLIADLVWLAETLASRFAGRRIPEKRTAAAAA